MVKIIGDKQNIRSVDNFSNIENASNTPRAGLSNLSLSDENIALMTEVAEFSTLEKDRKKIIYPEMKNSRLANSFRDLRNVLLEKSLGSNATIMVTSVLPKSGGTFVAVNLAAAFAFDGSKTALLVDANLSSPGICRYFGTDYGVGVTDFLENKHMKVEEIIYSSGVKRLRIIPAGKHSEYTSEYLSSERIGMFVHTLKSRYKDRYIIIDAPPLSDPASAKQVFNLCDWVVVVAPYGKVGASEIATAIEGIPKDKLAGVLVNDEPVVRDFL
ncbi:MAG: hypothetical protein KUG80_05185 [Gammaproteobacteria bacterium]|nr:hypothetical protein [Gammaproteobacteria bacterium]